MKKWIVIVAAMLLAMTAQAQESRMYRKGYLGSVEIGPQLSVGKNNFGGCMALLLENGGRFGNGMALSGITGAMMDLTGNLYVPLMVRGKYSILDRSISPFVSVQSGARFMIGDLNNCFTMGAAVGVDWSRFSASFGYEFAGGKIRNYYSSLGDVEELYKGHSLNLMFAVHF